MTFEENWQGLTTFLNKYYYKPDLEGLRIVLCTYLSHFYLTSPPVWLSVIGLPGTGKTEIAINPLNILSRVISESTLTTNSFLSGYGENQGILPQLEPKPNGHGIVVFPDLTTTLLSEDPLTRQKIMGIMRRVYDGEYDKAVGNKAKKLTWKGKVTCIAACTPDIEEHWATYRDMGERWLQIRWSTPKLDYNAIIEMADKATSHEGHEEKISNTLKNYISDIINEAIEHGGSEDIPKSKELTALAILLEEMRVTPKREFTGRGYEVTGTGNKQSISRTVKSLSIIAKASSCLRQSKIIEEEDIHLAKRIAIDSIPFKRKILLDALIGLYPNTISKGELCKISGFPRSSFDRVIEDLRYLDIITSQETEKKKLELFSDDEEEEDLSNTPYGYKRPKASAQIRLNSSIINILVDCNLLSVVKTRSNLL